MTKWTTDNIPDQSGRIAIITGSNSGIGFEAAKALAEKGAEVILAVRSQAKGDAAIASIQAETTNAKLQVRLLDLADLASIKSFAEQFNADYQRLDLLINNAGIMVPPYSKTVDGFESQFGTNHLLAFLPLSRTNPITAGHLPGASAVLVGGVSIQRGDDW